MSTESRPRNTETEESETLFRAIADSLPAMVWTSRADMQCDYLNRSWLEFTGRKLEQELGFGWADGVHPDDKNQCLDTYTTSFAKREPFKMEYRYRRYDDVYRWILDIAQPRFNADGTFAGYSGSCTDVTDYKDMTRQLTEAKDQVEAAARSRSLFLANISHELRTPLNAILGFAEAMTLGIGGTPAQKHEEYLSYIQKSGALLLGILNDLIDLSKIDAGQEELVVSAVSVEDAIGACCAMIRPRTDAAGLNLKINVPERIPRLSADERRLKQAILNLLSNATKFTPSGGTIDISAEVRQSGGMAISVKDTGRGIGAADIPRVIEPFGQVGRADLRNPGGAGLGLPLTKRLIELHGGIIEIESRPGRGTNVTLLLPAARVLPQR